jgi:hypothetical protein
MSNATAADTATKMLAQIGVSPGPMYVQQGRWSISVQAAVMLDDLELRGETYSFLFEPEGRLISADGLASLPVRREDVTLISIDEALSRLRDKAPQASPAAPAPADSSTSVALPTPSPAVGVPATIPGPTGIECGVGETQCPVVAVNHVGVVLRAGDPAAVPVPGVVDPPTVVEPLACDPQSCPIPPPPGMPGVRTAELRTVDLVVMNAEPQGSQWLVPVFDFREMYGERWQVSALSDADAQRLGLPPQRALPQPPTATTVPGSTPQSVPGVPAPTVPPPGAGAPGLATSTTLPAPVPVTTLPSTQEPSTSTLPACRPSPDSVVPAGPCIPECPDGVMPVADECLAAWVNRNQMVSTTIAAVGGG